MIEKVICPNGDTYSVLVKGLCDKGQVSAAKELVDKMLGQGVKLDGSMLDILIYFYFKAGMIEDAHSAEMTNVSAVLNEYIK